MQIEFDEYGQFWRTEDGAEDSTRVAKMDVMECPFSVSIRNCSTRCPMLRLLIGPTEVEINGCEFSYVVPAIHFTDKRTLYVGLPDINQEDDGEV